MLIPDSSSPAPIRILLADDHTGLRRHMRRLLEAVPGLLVCAEAADGDEAVRLASEARPDVVVLDLSMPLLSGIEATRHIRAARPGTRIVIVTLHPLPNCPAPGPEGPNVHAWVPKQEMAGLLVPAVLACSTEGQRRIGSMRMPCSSL